MPLENASAVHKLTALAALKTLQNLDNLNIDLTPVTDQLTVISNQISQIPTTDLSSLNTKLDSVLTQLDQINIVRQNAIQYRQLTLNPTFEVGGNWATAPTNLIEITDTDEATSTNVFQTADGAWMMGWINVVPIITIPSLTRLKTKIWIANSQSLRSFSEVAVLNSANEFIPIWANEDPVSSSGRTINIDVIIPYAYSKVKYRIMDTTQYYPRMQIYDLKIFEVVVV